MTVAQRLSLLWRRFSPLEERLIASVRGGYLLIYGASDGSMDGDTWHDTLEAAEAAALESFALEPSDWETGEHEDAG